MVLLKRFKEEMKIKTKIQSIVKPYQIEPLVSGVAHIKRNISSSSKSMLLLNKHEAVLNEISSSNDYASLIQNRTVVTYPDGLKKTEVKTQENSNALLISIPPTETNVPKHTIATQDFMLRLLRFQFKPSTVSQSPSACNRICEDQGNILVAEANNHLRRG